VAIDGVEDLRHILGGRHVNCVPLGCGVPRGTILHASIGEVALRAGQLSADVRFQAGVEGDRISFSMKLDSDGGLFSFRSGKQVMPGDVYRLVRGDVNDCRLSGPLSFALISLSIELLARHGGDEALRGEVGFWEQRTWFRAPEATRMAVVRSVRRTLAYMFDPDGPMTGQALRQLQSELVEPFLWCILSNERRPDGRQASAATIVRNVENWVDGQSPETIQIADLCRALRLSRRTLHRAFAETLGVGPAAYLTRKRLTAVRAELRRSDPLAINVTDTATKYGFWELGRFARDYRRMFGERPSETLNKGMRLSARPPPATIAAWS